MACTNGRNRACLLALVGIAVPALGGIIPIPILPTPPPANASGQACTTYITSTYYGFRGDFTPEIEKTVYTSTVTKFEHVQCGGCELAFTAVIASPFGGHGPVERITGTTTATVPSIATATVCATVGHHGPPPPTPKIIDSDLETPYHENGSQDITKDDDHEKNNAHKVIEIPTTANATTSLTVSPPEPSECTYTRMVPLTPLLGGTSTVWPTTQTITSHINCDGCKYVTASTRNFLNPGPVVHFTTTITAAVPSNTTVFQCLKTPSVVDSPTVVPPITPTVTPALTPTIGGRAVVTTPTPPPITITRFETKYTTTVTRTTSIVCEPPVVLPVGAIPRNAGEPGSYNVQIGPGPNAVIERTTVWATGARTILAFTCTATTTRKYPYPIGSGTVSDPIFPPLIGPQAPA